MKIKPLNAILGAGIFALAGTALYLTRPEPKQPVEMTDERLTELLEDCKDFEKNNDSITYLVKKGDTKIGISRKFNNCVKYDEDFCKSLEGRDCKYERLDVLGGDVCIQPFIEQGWRKGTCPDKDDRVYEGFEVKINAKKVK